MTALTRTMPLSDLNPTGRFSDRAADYVKHRPSYPREAIDAILDGLGEPPWLLAVDVGAGTGISARLLAERGVRVIAVEPNAAMREAGRADRRLGEPKYPVDWRDGTAEATGLAAGSVDLVLCAQAFHWFRPDESLREFHRILRPTGRLALMWNQRSRTDPFTAGYRQALLDVGAEPTAERMEFDPAVVARAGLFGPPRLVELPTSQRLDLDGLIGRAMSASYVPRTGPQADRLVAMLRELHARHADADGFVMLVMATQIYLTECV
ncbi:MAG: class I SAM-dependent methyltransferase [Phycisphaerales bacterium]